MIEFMIAMSIGMMMIMASFVVYRQNLSDFIRQEQTNEMLENARTALYFMGEDIKMAGFFGNITNNSSIDDTDTNLLTIIQDCGTPTTAGEVWAIHDRPNFSYLSQVSAATANATHPCIATADFQATTDVLVVKRVASAPVTTYTNNKIYLRATSSSGTLIKQMAGTAAPAAGTTVWEYLTNVYFIRNNATTAGDGIPSLYRKTLQVTTGTTMAEETGGIGEGIQQFRVLFGIDANLDGIAEYYTATPTTANFANVSSVRLYILVRSSKTIAKYTNSKTYTLGDISYTAPGDGFIRKVFSTTIATRNIINARSLL